MKLLVLGGTVFLGRHIVEAALAAGDDVTLFHRGRHGADLYPNVTRVLGDRRVSLAPLGGQRFDALVDTSGYLPSEAARVVRELGPSVAHRVFVSSVSVYKDFAVDGIDESYPCAELSEAELEEGESLDRENPENRPRFYALYGALKAASERAFLGDEPSRATIVRPGLIVGPHDPSDRFTYWPSRIAKGGDVLVPGPPDRAVQIIDARDVADFLLHVARGRVAGTFNAVGPERPLTMAALFSACDVVANGGASPVWVSAGDLLEAGVTPWTEIPLWAGAESDPDVRGLETVSARAAIGAGLRFRPLKQTIADTLAWDALRPYGQARRAGLSTERESELLERCAQS